MSRGIRGATTVEANETEEILANTKALIEEMIQQNKVEAEDVSHVFLSLTKDLNACFPAKVLRQIDGWKYVPVMCMAEVDVPGSLPKCIRVMMVANTDKEQQEIQHIYHQEAVKLRPDLTGNKGE